MTKPRRMDGYIRVSRRMGREGPGYISPDVQREAIQKWADYRGIEIVAWHVDEDESGGTQARPGMRAFMRRMKNDETDGIAVWKFDRFARNVHEAIGDVKQMQARGKHLAAVTEDIDPSGPFGSFILTIMLAVATLQRDNLVASWQTAKARAIKRGAKIGPAPFGYRRQEDGRLAPDPDEARIVREAFRLTAQDSIEAATRYLRAATPERSWRSPSKVRDFLANRTYLGEVRYGELVSSDAHPALVSRGLWEAAQVEGKRRKPNSNFPLSGIARCANCGGPLAGGHNGSGSRVYKCSRASNRGATHCAEPSQVNADNLERYVADELRTAWQHPGFEIGEDSQGAANAEQELLELEAELNAFASDLTARKLLGERYHEHLHARVEAVEAAQRTYRELAAQAETRQVIPTAEEWAKLSGDDLADVYRGALASVVVKRGRRALDERVTLVLHGSDDAAGIPASEHP